MRYEAYEYLWPPRPGSKQATPPGALAFYEKEGWLLQYKKNGTCNVVFVSPDRKQIIFKNRHNADHAQWAPNPVAERAFRALPGNGWCVLVGELLNNKVKGGVRNTTYLFDILVDNGDYLVGKTFDERQDHLYGLFPKFQDEAHSHYLVDDNTWVAKTFAGGFRSTYDQLSDPMDEGIVFKKADAVLESCSRQAANQQWNRKTRRPTANYPY